MSGIFKYVSYSKIADHLDIKSGDIILVGSDIFKLMFTAKKHGEIFDADKFIDSFTKKLGNGGTLLFPTFNWGFCSGKRFDIRNTPSQTGYLSNVALKKNDFIRTGHPIYSFAVWGKHSDSLRKLENVSGWGADSVFAFLHANKAKMLMIGLDYHSCFTFVHYVEEYEKVKVRYYKKFTGEYVDKNGISSIRTYLMFVRDIDNGVENEVNPMGKILEEKGISVEKIINGVSFKLVDLYNAFIEIQRDIRENKARNIYKVEL